MLWIQVTAIQDTNSTENEDITYKLVSQSSCCWLVGGGGSCCLDALLCMFTQQRVTVCFHSVFRYVVHAVFVLKFLVAMCFVLSLAMLMDTGGYECAFRTRHQ